MGISIGICGEGTIEPNMHKEEGQELIYKLCHNPVPANKISNHLLESFKSVNAIRIENNLCYLNFTCFLQKDIDYLNFQCDELGKILAERIQKYTTKYTALEVTYDEVNIEKLLFFIVGCVCLDWNGLKILEELNLTLSHEEQEKPGYGNYTLFGNEDTDKNVKELYWGSHNSKYGNYYFTTFGDHTGRRIGFPDLIHINPSQDIMIKLFTDMLNLYMNKIGDALTKRVNLNESTKSVLEDLKYIKNGQLNIPVIVFEDMPSIDKLIISVDEIIKDWLIEYSSNLKFIFKNLTPIKFGVEFREVLIQIWHYIFGHTNKHLSRNGYFFNPYSNTSDFAGYLPVVHEVKCDLKLF